MPRCLATELLFDLDEIQPRPAYDGKVFCRQPHGTDLLLLGKDDANMTLHGDGGVLAVPGIGRWFKKQETNTTCAIASLALTAGVAHGDALISESSLVERLAPLLPSDLATKGMTLQQLVPLVDAAGLRPSTHLASDSSVEAFRDACCASLRRGVPVIVNYDMTCLGQEGVGGHFSVVGAYAPSCDRFLLLDVWPETPLVWATASQLYAAMDTIDGDSARSRGFIIVERKDGPGRQSD
ncbi:unnamed protein product [Vitrella brassicaformis CCMP3155]|uniref:glutathione gamma-glutamylcysteinyltransferase n=1 Tax=Vitrella brassicaformis (strain CCMP3155) TaxID=1169540 RepID=A0A0G4EU06_VITBC|nr:unnamed protein product [Vitrella brassicaformis CCMP3155]|mmetsp:Transcript_32186/g.79751  ORF Transcript_32186/g.79751 Transcript_32186/m.79751 type:complete len:238 (-) Transcript_32186:141-854(-)|eukprot:CEM01745.1 unnamed protein product [Vitrella brassicaformis CCMP3155]